MSERFRNVVFIICIVGCLLTMGLNLLTQRVVNDTFESLYNEAAKAQQIMVAQDYALSTATLAEHASQRAHELDQKLEVAAEQFLKLIEANKNLAFQQEMNNVSIKAQAGYITQLREYISENNLPIPEPDMNRILAKPIEPPPSGVDEDGSPIDPTEAAPVPE